MAEHIAFSEHLIMAGFCYAFGVSTADLAGNGRLDLVATDTDAGLYWFENHGDGHFTRHIIHQRQGEWLERHAIADINGDGRPEIVVVDNINGSLLYFEYSGDPRDRGSWQAQYILEGELPGAYDVAIADFDGDGDLDVAASSWRKGNQFVWCENRKGRWIRHAIEENIAETRAVCAVDMNGNGLMDLLGTASADDQVIWYENPGDPVNEPWKKHVIDTPSRPIHGHPADLDGDGGVDVVMALGQRGGSERAGPGSDQILWYEHGGDPARCPWERHVICDCFPQAFEAVAADVDGDGQVEVVATGWGEQGRVALFKHQGDPRGEWTAQMLKENWTRANQVLVVDLDGDGRLDIVATAERGSNELRWWRNEGPV